MLFFACGCLRKFVYQGEIAGTFVGGEHFMICAEIEKFLDCKRFVGRNDVGNYSLPADFVRNAGDDCILNFWMLV